ncbi:MAG: hypothetical protein U5K69_10290 [Balneolaceae bacterium]|nr:hypothetical protein [Balneolaceae bacterium]
MKRTLSGLFIIALSVLFASNPASAQTTTDGHLGVGVMIGEPTGNQFKILAV